MGQVTQIDGAGRDADRRQEAGRRQYKPRARQCACGCGVMVTPTKQAPHKAYASDACRKRANRRKLAKLRKREPVARGWEPGVCQHCGQALSRIPGQNKKYCSSTCKTLAWRKRRAAAIEAVAELAQTDVEQVRDAVDRYGLAKATEFLHKRGFQYDERARRWIRAERSGAA